jgi:hypothetical protein
MPADKAAAEVDSVRRMVNLEPKPMATGTVTKVATATTEPQPATMATTKIEPQPTSDPADGEADAKLSVKADVPIKSNPRAGAKPKTDASMQPKVAAAEAPATDAASGWTTKVATTKAGR